MRTVADACVRKGGLVFAAGGGRRVGADMRGSVLEFPVRVTRAAADTMPA